MKSPPCFPALPAVSIDCSIEAGRVNYELTKSMARYAATARFEALPASVRAHTVNAFVNWLGCAHGGCREPAIGIACECVAEAGGHTQSTVIGQPLRTDVANAAFINCISSSIQAFDDAHLPTVTHPSGPAASALFAISESRSVSGDEFLTALALGIEVQCRLSNVMVLPPSQMKLGFYVTGLTAPIGVAAAVGRLLRLDEQRMTWALGIASSQASGYRASHGTMTAHFRPGHATRAGVVAALLAEKGFDCTGNALEATNGFLDVYSPGCDAGLALRNLGEQFELLLNAYKPYPCGIVIHPTIDACLEIRSRIESTARIGSVTLRVNPAALTLTGKRLPRTPLESHVSLYHWAAVTLLTGKAGLAENQMRCINDPAIAALRAEIKAVADPSIGPGESRVEVRCDNGQTLESHIRHARGSIERPMNEADLDRKFMTQVEGILPVDRATELLRVARNLTGLDNVGEQIAATWAS
jgi:2-methylcitrate dehydratase PrpD